MVTYKNTGRSEADAASTPPRLQIVAFVNQKGGVAKTTTAVNLAASFARLEKKVLLVDLDPQGHAGLGLGIDIHADIHTMYDVLIDSKDINEIIIPTYLDGLCVAPANIQLSTADLVTSGMLHRNILLKKALKQVPNDFDYVFLDCPPTIGILTYNALIACTDIFVPVEMDFYALEGMSQLINTIQLVNEVRDEPIDVSRVIVTKYEQNTRVAQAALNNIREFFGDRVCQTYIRKNTTIREAPSEGKTILDYAPNSTGATDYWGLAQEILSHKESEVSDPATNAPEAVTQEDLPEAESSQEEPATALNNGGNGAQKEPGVAEATQAGGEGASVSLEEETHDETK